MATVAGALPNRVQRTAVRVSEFDFSRGMEEKAKGNATASRRSTGWFNTGWI
jgi:hypothetical protein